MTERNLMAESWEAYCNKCYPDGQGKDQGEQTKCAFYAGAMVVVIAVLAAAAMKSLRPDTAAGFILSIQKEIEEELKDGFKEKPPEWPV